MENATTYFRSLAEFQLTEVESLILSWAVVWWPRKEGALPTTSFATDLISQARDNIQHQIAFYEKRGDAEDVRLLIRDLSHLPSIEHKLSQLHPWQVAAMELFYRGYWAGMDKRSDQLEAAEQASFSPNT